MKTKKKFSNEMAFVVGIILIVIGVTFCVKANFGVSMIVAPAFVLQKYIGGFFGFFTMGIAEYAVQTFLLILMIILMRKFKIGFLFCFVTAVIYGLLLDGNIYIVNLILPYNTLPLRFLYFAFGLLSTAFGVALMFRTYLPPQSYDYFVREVSPFFGADIKKFKLWYDAAFCIVAIVLSFVFFGKININEWWGTIFCTVVNGRIIGFASKFYEKHFDFYDRFKWRKYFVVEK